MPSKEKLKKNIIVSVLNWMYKIHGQLYRKSHLILLFVHMLNTVYCTDASGFFSSSLGICITMHKSSRNSSFADAHSVYNIHSDKKNGTVTLRPIWMVLQMHIAHMCDMWFGDMQCVTFFNTFHLLWHSSSGKIASKTFALQTWSYI